MNKEAGGVVIALLGFAALTLAFKGTWSNVYHALVTGTSTVPGGTGAGAATVAGKPGSGTPGSGPAPVAPTTQASKNAAAG